MFTKKKSQFPFRNFLTASLCVHTSENIVLVYKVGRISFLTWTRLKFFNTLYAIKKHLPAVLNNRYKLDHHWRIVRSCLTRQTEVPRREYFMASKFHMWTFNIPKVKWSVWLLVHVFLTTIIKTISTHLVFYQMHSRINFQEINWTHLHARHENLQKSTCI